MMYYGIYTQCTKRDVDNPRTKKVIEMSRVIEEL